AARHRRHHPDYWPFGGRERAHFRTIARRNGSRKIAQGSAEYGVRESFQLHFRRQRDDDDYHGNSVLKGERPGESISHFTYPWHFSLVVHSAHRWAQLPGLACRYRKSETHFDVALDFSTKHQFSRQRLYRVHVLTRTAFSRRVRLLPAR